MSTALSNNLDNFLTLEQASEKLNVSIQTLLSWNKHNILKPTITQQGEIGYTKEQIDQFLTIRQISTQSPDASQPAASTQPAASKPTVPMTDGLLREDFAHVDLKRALSTTEGTIKSTSFRLMVSFGTILIVILSAIFSQPEGFGASDAQKMGVNKDNILGAQTSKLNLSDQIVSALPLGRDSDKKNLKNEGDDEANRNIEAIALYQEKTQTTRNNTKSALLTTRINRNTTGTNTTLPTSFASTTFPGKTDANAAIDDLGNIKGEAKSDTLATVVGGIEAMMGNDSFKQGQMDTTTQAIFLILGLLGILFLFPKQMAFSFKRHHGTKTTTPTYADMPSPRILEVDQKTDGTVVLYFQGKEYKVSKPELSSESDQFIERLMTLTQPGVKEIEYDLFNTPEGVTLTTPLSRLVTRLGFVGIKRDLFFPRTSKSEVLFRKYITQEDLSLMNLSSEQILNDLVKTS